VSELGEERSPESSGVHARPTTPPPEPIFDPASAADVFGLTDVGCVRQANQDQFLVAELSRGIRVQSTSPGLAGVDVSESTQGRLLAVADGMGGYRGGEVASAVALETFAAYALAVAPWVLVPGKNSRELVAESLRTAVAQADVAVHQISRQLALDERMGSTLTATYVAWPEAYVVHVGDSRAYLWRDGELTQLTSDHTLAQELVEQDAMTRNEALLSRLRHVLVNAVGGLRGKRLDVDVDVIELRSGDMLVLATDGLAAHLDDADLRAFCANATGAESLARELVHAVKLRGAQDNVTVVVGRF
jgi:protein phosphatase